MFASTSRLVRSLTIGSAALLLTFSAACESAASTALDPEPGTESSVPTQLVGQWLHGIVSMSGYVDAYNGQWLDNAYGTSVMFEFAPNGTYKQAIFIKTSVYSCRMQVYIYNEGKAVVDGDTINWMESDLIAHDPIARSMGSDSFENWLFGDLCG